MHYIGSPTRGKRPAQEDPGDAGEERPNAYQCTDGIDDYIIKDLNTSPAVDSPVMEIAKNLIDMSNIQGKVDETVGGKEMMQHPGPIIRTKEITSKEKQWTDVGSGVFARTFPCAERMVTTTRGGPPMEDIHRRTIWSLSSGKVIDDCIVDDVPDRMLNWRMGEVDDIRVELVMKDALCMYNRKGADIAEVYSQPRVAQAAAE